MTPVETKTMKIMMIGPRFDCRGGISPVSRMLFDFLLREGVMITYLPSTIEANFFWKCLYALGSYVRFLVLLASGRFDVIHVHCSVNKSFFRKFFYLFIAVISGRRLIVQIHPERFYAFFSLSPRPIRYLIRFIFARSRAVIVLTASIRKKMSEISPRDNVVVLNNPVNCAEFDGKAEMNGNQVLFMGFISPEKGAFDILDIVPEVAKLVPLVRFAFFGPVKTSRSFDAFRDPRLGKNVQWKAWVTGKEKVRIYHQSRMLLLPSYSEGLPNVILEAMASSLPVVTTPVGGISELITDGVNGFLIKPGDKAALGDRILRLLNDKDLCLRMGKISREIVEKRYDTSIVGRKLLDLYSWALERSSGQ